MLSRAKPSGFGFHDKFTSTEAEFIDAQLPDAVDGAGGGSYAPTNIISIAGQGLTCESVLNAGASSTVSFRNGFTCYGTAVIEMFQPLLDIGINGGEVVIWCPTAQNGDVAVAATANVTYAAGAGVFQCDKATAFSRNVGCSQLLTCTGGFRVATGTTNLETTTNVSGPLNLSGVTSVSGSVALTGIARVEGAGRIVGRFVSVGNSDHTYTISDGDMFYVGNQTADHQIQFSSTGAEAGNVVEISAEGMGGGHLMTVKNNAGSALCTLLNTSGNIIYAKLWFTGADWVLADHSTLA